MKTLYIISKCKKDDSLYGAIHGADNSKTLCGKKYDQNWYILNSHEPNLKDITCKKCLKLLDT